MPELDALANVCKEKIGFIFTDKPAFELKPIIEGNRVKTAAKVGAIAPIDVVIPPGPTGLDPSQIGFFHALKISTKIQKGQIEITKDFTVCTKGKEVTNSEAVLLQKLSIKPFEYGMILLKVYDSGSILTPEILSLTPDEICKSFAKNALNIRQLPWRQEFLANVQFPL